MATIIQFKRTNTASKVPTTTDITLGEICINTTDGEMFFKKDNGAESIIKLASTNNLKTVNNNNLIGNGNIIVSLPTKSGILLNTDFTGNPKTATISFTTAFSDNNYSISVIGEDSRVWSIENKSASGFTINANANQSLTGNVFFIATKHGEV